MSEQIKVVSRKHVITELFDNHPHPNMEKDDFDDQLWSMIVEMAPWDADIKNLPFELRVYYATRYVEWSAAFDGLVGFADTEANSSGDTSSINELIGFMIEGYETLERPEAVGIMRKLLAAIIREFGKDEGDFEDLEAISMDDLWSDSERLSYVVKNKQVFIDAIGDYVPKLNA